jgi:TRAP-type C4-dicarboxylate transport system permease small subunit
LGIAIGFREKLHLQIDIIDHFLSEKAKKVLDKIILAVVFGFGLYLIISGTEFTIMTWESTLAATKLPNGVLYLVIPITGVLVCVYSALQLAGIDTRRHKHLKEGH